MAAPEDGGVCPRCCGPLDDAGFSCWRCGADLCRDCGDGPGHCGHQEAIEIAERSRGIGFDGRRQISAELRSLIQAHNVPFASELCKRCSAAIPVGPHDSCSVCGEPMCNACWETKGHCGHPGVDERIAKAEERLAAKEAEREARRIKLVR